MALSAGASEEVPLGDQVDDYIASRAFELRAERRCINEVADGDEHVVDAHDRLGDESQGIQRVADKHSLGLGCDVVGLRAAGARGDDFHELVVSQTRWAILLQIVTGMPARK